MKRDSIAMQIMNALNESDIGYTIDYDGSLYWHTKEDAEKGEALIAEIKEKNKSKKGRKKNV
jgi:hypothetical protein